MNTLSDDEVLERFEAKLAAIDAEVHSRPPLRRGRWASSPAGRWSSIAIAAALGTIVVLLVGVVAVGSLRSTQAPSGPASPQATSPSGPPAAAATQSAPATAFPSFADGIPSEIDGERVYRPSAVPTPADASPWLVGGWSMGYIMPSCAVRPRGTPIPSAQMFLAPDCPNGFALNDLRDGTGARLWPLRSLRPIDLPVDQAEAIVLRVHRHDPLAAQCLAADRAACEGAIVIDSVVWTAASSQATSASPTASSNGLTVSDFLAARSAGTLGDGPITLRGYWSWRETGHMCAAPTGQPGILEMYCQDGESGITELNEPVLTFITGGLEVRAVAASGPVVTPYVSEELLRRLIGDGVAYKNGNWPPPVPIVVVGHVNDARAALCRPVARELCRDRFVVDQIVQFDPASVPTPTPSPSPTPLPSPAPAALFTNDRCFGNVPYSFVGWTTPTKLDIGDTRTANVYAMVTRDVIALGKWTDDPQRKGHRFRVWGRGVCYTDTPDAMLFSEVTGTAFRLYDDGKKVPGI